MTTKEIDLHTYMYFDGKLAQGSATKHLLDQHGIVGSVLYLNPGHTSMILFSHLFCLASDFA